MLRECTKNERAELELMDKWYKRDDNCVPAVFILQPISSILTNFNNKVNLTAKQHHHKSRARAELSVHFPVNAS